MQAPPLKYVTSASSVVEGMSTAAKDKLNPGHQSNNSNKRERKRSNGDEKTEVQKASDCTDETLSKFLLLGSLKFVVMV